MTQPRPVRFAGAELGRHRHVCAFFASREEEDRVLHPFVREGLERGEKVFQIVAPGRVDEHLARLRAAGVDTEAAVGRGALEVRAWSDAYLRGGRFDQDAMLPLWDDILSAARVNGFPLTRVTGPTDWAVEDPTMIRSLLEYEARVNLVSARHADPLICLYDPTRFSADVALDILRTHPLVVIGGVLRENPFFVPPDEFLRELAGRASHA